MTLDEAMERVKAQVKSDRPRDVDVWPGTEAYRLILADHERLKDAATDNGYNEMLECAKGWEAKAKAAEAEVERLRGEAEERKAWATAELTRTALAGANAQERAKRLEAALRAIAEARTVAGFGTTIATIGDLKAIARAALEPTP